MFYRSIAAATHSRCFHEQFVNQQARGDLAPGGLLLFSKFKISRRETPLFLPRHRNPAQQSSGAGGASGAAAAAGRGAAEEARIADGVIINIRPCRQRAQGPRAAPGRRWDGRASRPAAAVAEAAADATADFVAVAMLSCDTARQRRACPTMSSKMSLSPLRALTSQGKGSRGKRGVARTGHRAATIVHGKRQCHGSVSPREVKI